jgi:hypothetical protein
MARSWTTGRIKASRSIELDRPISRRRSGQAGSASLDELDWNGAPCSRVPEGAEVIPGPLKKSAMQSTLTKLLEAARHMVDTFIDRLPSLILAIAVFIAYSR